jgi:hypothetical protein
MIVFHRRNLLAATTSANCCAMFRTVTNLSGTEHSRPPTLAPNFVFAKSEPLCKLGKPKSTASKQGMLCLNSSCKLVGTELVGRLVQWKNTSFTRKFWLLDPFTPQVAPTWTNLGLTAFPPTFRVDPLRLMRPPMFSECVQACV